MSPRRFAISTLLFSLVIGLTLIFLDRCVPRRYLESLPFALQFEVDRSLESSGYSSNQIVFLGDSVVGACSSVDTDLRSIAGMLSDHVVKEVVDESHAAFGQRLINSQLHGMLRTGGLPAAVVVPVNLRSFCSTWETTPGWRFKNVEMANRYNIYCTLRAYYLLTGADQDFEAMPRSSSAPQNPTRAEIVAGIRKAYLYHFEQSESFEYFEDNLELSKSFGVPVVFYLTPVDWEHVTEYAEPDDLQLIESNLRELARRLEAAGVKWVDLSRKCSKERFTHPPSRIDEHLDQEGRLQVAREVANLLEEFRR